MLGLVKGEFRLVPHSFEWRRLFEEERARLNSLIGDYVVRIEHVGSTSLPIMAKPVIDIAVGMNDLAKVENCVKILSETSVYVYKGENGIPGRHLFAKYNGPKGTHHLHFQIIGSNNWQNQILFRDYLLDHPDYLKEYEDLKKRLVEDSQTRLEYTENKDEFIKMVINLAKESGYSAAI